MPTSLDAAYLLHNSCPYSPTSASPFRPRLPTTFTLLVKRPRVSYNSCLRFSFAANSAHQWPWSDKPLVHLPYQRFPFNRLRSILVLEVQFCTCPQACQASEYKYVPGRSNNLRISPQGSPPRHGRGFTSRVHELRLGVPYPPALG